MKLAVLFSGGKDSCYALFKAKQYHEIACLISLKSKNKESYMFHTPNINLTEMQAEAMDLPLFTAETEGVKEKELIDLTNSLIQAKAFFNIEGVVTGAIASVYQASRIKKICDDLSLMCLNPLWQMDQKKLLYELIENNFEVIISGVGAYPFDEKWLGRRIDKKAIEELAVLEQKYKINPAGEGGELETFVVNSPMFRKKIIIKKAKKVYSNYAGTYIIEKAVLE